jgi:hypothetical protein
MRLPKKRKTAINEARIEEWLSRFCFYRHPPNRNSVEQWLARFAENDRDIGARLLDCVEVVPEIDIQKGYKKCAGQIPGWNRGAPKKGKWLIVGFGNAGESGAAMVRSFREANGLANRKFDKLFCTARDLPSQKLTAQDTVIFVDDFSGTGKQIMEVWPTLEELIASDAKRYLILTAITSAAYDRISTIDGLEVMADKMIKDEDNIFARSCNFFSIKEKAVLLSYCKKADRRHPKGFGDCGLLYILSHKTPNNSVPILHANHQKWIGLFPRYLNP